MNWLEVARRVVADKQAEEVEGTLLDGTTAQMLLSVYDGLQRRENKDKFSTMPLAKAVKVGWQLVSKLDGAS